MPELSMKETETWEGGQLHKDTFKHRAECVCVRPWMESPVWLPHTKIVARGRTRRERLVLHRRLWPLEEGTVINLLIALALSRTGLKSLAGCHLFMWPLRTYLSRPVSSWKMGIMVLLATFEGAVRMWQKCISKAWHTAWQGCRTRWAFKGGLYQLRTP